MGYAIAARVARPDRQVVAMLGDGAAGFSLMDVDTLVRHRLPVVMVVGNNGIWGLEKHPMQVLYGYDVAADLQPGCRYDEVVQALGGAGEIVERPDDIGPALDRAFAAGVPYLVNVLTDPGRRLPEVVQPGLRRTPLRHRRRPLGRRRCRTFSRKRCSVSTITRVHTRARRRSRPRSSLTETVKTSRRPSHLLEAWPGQ